MKATIYYTDGTIKEMEGNHVQIYPPDGAHEGFAVFVYGEKPVPHTGLAEPVDIVDFLLEDIDYIKMS